ncbi:hypothetical protein ABW20_dc0106608 [Dactylellina cionopaga]|nr:hypothetical protein ABW20_dc0106608 [Dactylellina cionopaga]
MGIKLSDDDAKRVDKFLMPAWCAATLLNDYYSFDEEYREFLKSGAGALTNGVWVFMKLNHLSVQEAKEAVRQKTIEFEQEFLRYCEEMAKIPTQYSLELRQYVGIWYYMVAGNFFWSLNCPRYSGPYKPSTPLQPEGVGQLAQRLHGATIKCMAPELL